ncbi:disease resistance protein RUN1-like [Corylus avellana]|uniref:disease resistance protein RUN1-like n=1 Tax=Corylus avellana TaxID=13451 RepID=UPI00286C84BD|nr:disease resistance protein RUN1-like [Corylus avellana]
MKLLLDIENNDSKCMIGIFRTGGIGKTTLAKAIYNSIASHFEDSCFLENIRETSNKKGLIHLQIKLISKILGGSSQMVDNVDQGITLIQQRLCLIRILLVLDDVDHSDQLEKIVGKGNWFGLRSRIIITTRDKHLLTKHQVLTYEVKELGYLKAHKLFSWHAFNRDRPDDDYVKVTNNVVCYAGGLPLALQVLGSSLKGKGENVEYVTKIVDSCGFHSYSGIEELKDKCLITEFSDKSLVIHELLQEMGREIVQHESPEEPSKHSRLWFHEDVCHVLEENMDNIIAEGGQDEEHPHDQVAIIVGVYSDGNEIYCPHGDYHKTCYGSLCYDQVWLHSYVLPEDVKLKRGDNLQICLSIFQYHTGLNFISVKHSTSVFFRSCRFHLVQKHEEKVIDLIQPSNRCRDDDDE